MAIEADGRRVALLARPGLARERLSSVLQQAGANCVMAADPTQLKPEELLEVHAQVVLVALDPLTEEALAQFDEVLSDVAVEVIYEEADHAASREGWDAARWQRHLVAKLQGHSNVLPPSGGADAADVSMAVSVPGDVPEVSDLWASDGLATSEQSDATVTHAGDTFETRDTIVPMAPSPFDPVSAELEDFGVDIDFPSSALPLPELSFPDLSTEDPDATATWEPQPLPGPDDPGQALPAHFLSADDGFDDFDFTLETDTPSVTDPAGGTGAGVFDPFEEPDFNALDVELTADAAVPAVSAEQADVERYAGLSLEDDTLDLRESETPESRDSFRRDLAELEQRISNLALVDDTPRKGPEHARGAILLLGGLGGPDAVRQLLGALPPDFIRPVLVQQRLEGGRYDRLVTQLQRATKLPVLLARPAQVAEPGTVYILADTVGATSGESGIRFSGDASDTVMAALPSSDSAVLLLSGSDPALVDAAFVHSLAGALVIGQSAEGCYDASSSSALLARGGEVAAPAELALRLSARWSNQGTGNVQ